MFDNDYLYSKMIKVIDGEAAQLTDFANLLDESLELDKLIKKIFPLDSYGNENEYIKIKGSKQLILEFNKINMEKLDIIVPLKDIGYMGLIEDNQIVINFYNIEKYKELKANGIYEFSYDFFENLFSMGKFSNYCIKYGYVDLLRENIKTLLEKRGSVIRQYRLIKNEDDYFLRALTSSRYQNYDNNIALYLSMLNLHKLAVEKKLEFRIEKTFLSDSYIRIFLEQENELRIPNVGILKFGVLITNNEIREGAFYMEVRYKITDEYKNTFYGMQPLKNSIFNITHGMGIQTLIGKIKQLNNLLNIENSMKDLIQGLSGMEKISQDGLFSLYKKIVNSKNELGKSTKDKFKEIYDKHDIENTKTIVEAFNKIDSITTDMDEKIFLERVYHEVIMELVHNNKQ
ncbi:hypothetical protein [Pectinatus haikarae]|uniref:Regulator of sigma D n=1 Tax=Pectinatus haikarae TaxID=349096 RepID=A0ABT9Y723_9FIRM|nr:hypothetical protein [Pectinatus haikarae]MDQ0203630.1 regulator of sigma D [Pectinatus haikarae]